MKKRLLDLSVPELSEEMANIGEKPFRAKQIYSWLIKNKSFSEMNNLPLQLKDKLTENYSEGLCEIEQTQVSSDKTRKYLMKMQDGSFVECVLMHYEYGNTICISTQVGCAMNCAFCASCKGGLIRNLSAGEILSQVIAVNADIGENGRNITNIVLMGTGEPLSNYGSVKKFLELINAKESLNISFRNISLSTCGIVPAIYRFADENIGVTLCLSLHSAFEQKRRVLMPIAEKYDIKETLAAMEYYQKKSGRRVIFEYLLIGGFNDTHEDALELKKILGHINCHINLIPYNEVEGAAFKAPEKGRVYGFLNELEKLKISATVRRSLGRDIDGACGQLRAKRMAKGNN